MAIQFACPHCHKKLSVRDELAGKKGACPACKKVIAVPSVTTSSPNPSLSPPLPDFEAMAASALEDKKEEVKEPTTVDFTCPQCDAELHLPADLAGKQSPCPECRRIIKVPLLQKTGPRDWRQPEKQVGPSGALRKDADMEGSWGTATSRGTVSRGALVEAAVIKEPRRKLTQRDWTIRIVAGVFALMVLVAGGWFATRLFRANLEQQGVDQAEALLAEGDQKLAGVPDAARPGSVAELHRLLGEYYLRKDQPDSQGRDGLKRLQLARQTASTIPDAAERQAVIRELLQQQLDLGLEGDELAATLTLATPPAFRFDMVRMLARQAAAGGNTESVAASAGKLRAAIQAAVPPQGTDQSEQLSCLAILGQELLRAGQNDMALQLAEAARAQHRPDSGFPRSLQALLLMLGLPDLATKDPELVAAARVEAAARMGNLAAARQVLDDQLKSPTRIKLEAILAYLDAALDKGQKEDLGPRLAEAMKLAEPNPDDTVWQRQKMAELLIAAGNLEEAEALISSFLVGEGKNRARLAVLKSRVQRDQAFDPASIPASLAPASPAYQAAVALVGRHNGKLDPQAASSWAESLSADTARPFAALGVSLGMLDRGK